MKYKLITAISNNRGIGKGGSLPWRIKEDLRFFSKMTKGKGNNAVIMGRKTWESLGGRYLVGRDNLILSSRIQKNETIDEDVVKSFTTLETIDEYVHQKNYDEVWVIGGGEIYKKYLEIDKLDTCYITVIHKEYDCDTFFPHLDKKWNDVGKMQLSTSQDFEVVVEKFVTYQSKDYP